MGKKQKPPPPLGAAESLLGAAETAAWCLAAAAAALVPDQKILRWKLLSLEAAVGALIILIAARWLLEREPSRRSSPLDLPMALYGGSALLFYALSPERGASALELTRMLFAAAAFFAASQGLGGVLVPRIWAASGAAAGLYALLQTRGGLGVLMVPLMERPTATFGNPIFLAAYLSASGIFAAGRALGTQGLERRLFSAAAALCLAGVWTTQTRAAIFGAAAAAALFALTALERRKAAALLAAITLLGLGSLFHFSGRDWTHGLIWKDTIALWKDHPWLGCGLGRFHIEFVSYASPALRALWPEEKVIVNFAHNEYLQVLAETGLAGLASLLFILGSALRWLFSKWRVLPPLEKAERGAYAFAAFALLFQAVVSPDIRFGVSSFIVFAFLGAATARAPEPLPPFPGRFALAGLSAVFIFSWGRLAAQPLIAQRRLEKEPGFHIEKDLEGDRLIKELEAQLAANPKDPDLAENLAFLYAKRKDWPAAVSRFELTAALKPELPGPYNNLGNIHYSLGERDKAINWWKKSLAVQDEQLDARLNLAKTLYESGRLKESGRYLEEVLRRDPKNEKAQILLKKMIE